jgi:hypothetical protein
MPSAPEELQKIFIGYNTAILKYDTARMDAYEGIMYGSDNWEGNTRENFPTAYTHILDRFPDCIFATYGVMMPHSVIVRHTGAENRNGKYIRIHIPLIVPEGDIGFEVACEEVDWSDIFGFNNQKLHSAWNNTEHPRLVFVFDILRSTCDLPLGIPWSKEDNDLTPRFPKTEIVN